MRESKRRKAGLVAPTCEACGERFNNALNELLRREETHITIAPLVHIFWAREQTADDDTGIAPLLKEARPEQVKALFEGAWRGQRGHDVAHRTKAERYYAATVGGAI